MITTTSISSLNSPHPLSGQKISPEIYDKIWNFPKVLLHEHFSGSSDLFEMARIAQLYIDQGLGETLDWIDPHSGECTPVSTEFLRKNLSARSYFLCTKHLARLYRFTNPPERDEIFVKRSHLNEDGSLSIPEDELQKTIEGLREKGLSNYRATSIRINRLVKNEQFVYGLASAFARQLALENVLYAECRVSPLSYHCESVTSLIDRISEGLKLGTAEANNNLKSIQTGILLVIERHAKNNVQEAIRLAHTAIELRLQGYPVVGIDVAGDEWNYPVTLFAPAFDIIKNYNEDTKTPNILRLGITVHAGEVGRSGPLLGYESVQKAIELASSERTPIRIGHGTQIIHSSSVLRDAFQAYLHHPESWESDFPKEFILENSPLLNLAIARKITFEMCPKSNVHTFAVPYYERHPAVFLSRLGLKVSLSSDNRLISKTNASNEFVKLFKYAHADYDDMKRMVLAGFEGAFIMDAEKKEQLIQHFLIRSSDEHDRLTFS
jgi:adenosine deaminase